jgi:hypothetical protein
LLFVVLGVSAGSREKGITAGIAVGAVVTLEALFAGPICGASMNPARSLGPAVVSGRLASLWIYLVAPPLGTVLACCSLFLSRHKTSMKTTEFKNHLNAHPEHTLVFELPDGERIPVQAHITEAGRVDKSFIDCGGTVRTISTCQLQAWVDENDDAHRLSPGKLAGVLGLAAPLLRGDDLPVEIEYEDCTLSQYPVSAAGANGRELVFALSEKHTDCLAPEFCGVARGESEACC